jgi:Zn-dependent M28 family amino/carboxypeptidase
MKPTPLIRLPRAFSSITPRALVLILILTAFSTQLTAQTGSSSTSHPKPVTSSQTTSQPATAPTSQPATSQPPATSQSASQPAAAETQARIASTLPADQAIAPLMYLASDRLKGRSVSRPEIDTAARYIADQFQSAGARAIPGATGYFQLFTMMSDSPRHELHLKNVMAYIQGTDPALQGQYIVLSAHYDHLGVTKHPKMEDGKLDSIYNGARDNALGSTAVIDAAKYFGRYPPKRSVMFVTYSAEEEGLIGSEYYAAHPIIPLNQTVYNLNIDNASYNDTTLISLVGLNRTSEDSNIISACKAYGLSVNGDPTGGQLFYESDNAPLAKRGIPAPTYSLGMRTFDSTIFNRYHRLSDETGNMDMHYAVKFIRAYILSAIYIADDAAQPMWTKGDMYEKEWLKLQPR